MKISSKKQSSISNILEYQVNIVFDPRNNIFVARIPELENCHTHGNTQEEALANAHEAIELWVETAKENGITVPEPVSRKQFSGKFVIRTPEKIHAALVQEALKQGKSMNELAVEYLSSGLKRAS
jgi:predicted RNase H-like HicB family nuclease